MRKITWLASAMLPLWVEVAPAAVDCPRPGREHVRLVFNHTEERCLTTEPPLLDRIAKLVSADLASEQVEVCLEPPSRPRLPLAMITVSIVCDSKPLVQIVVSDAVTKKELSRQVPLMGLPEDTHAMAIAVGAVELLRASWAETRLSGTTVGNGQYPGAVDDLLGRPSIVQFPRASTTVGVVGEAFTGGLRQVGMDAEFAWAMHARFEALARLGGRRSRNVASSNGSVSADVWLAGLGLSYRLAQPSTKVQLRLTGRVDTAWVDFSSTAKKGAVAIDQGVATAWSSVGLLSAVRFLDNAWLSTEVLGGWVLLPVVATDASASVMGVQGGYVAGRLGTKIYF